MPINILVVDDSIVFRTKLNLSLTKDPELKVFGTAVDVEDALKKIATLKPAFDKRYGIVYVLPETKPLSDVFAV